MPFFFRAFILGYFLLFFLVLMVLRSVIVWKQTGKNPFVIPGNDTAYGLIGLYFKVTMLLLAAFVFANFFLPQHYHYFLPIGWLENIYLKDIGVGIMILSLIWIYVAQSQMSQSWRIGIDEADKTELITHGLFKFSRNPIFLGMVIALLGLFMVAPNAVTLLVLVVAYVLIQIQVRLEEEYLTTVQGTPYKKYQEQVRRWL